MSDPAVTARDRAEVHFALDGLSIRILPYRIELEQDGKTITIKPRDAASARSFASWLKEGQRHLLSLSNILACRAEYLPGRGK